MNRASSRARQRGAHAIAAAALSVTLTACPGGRDGIPEVTTTSPGGGLTTAPPSSPPATTGTTVTSAAGSPEDIVKTRYLAFWDARFQANQAPPNPDFPGLREYATGQQLETVISETRRNLEGGLALRHPDRSVARSSVRVVELKGDTATLQECVVDDGIIYRFQTGEVVNDTVATHSVSATMQMVEGRWKLAEAKLLQRWEGVAGCAVATS